MQWYFHHTWWGGLILDTLSKTLFHPPKYVMYLFIFCTYPCSYNHILMPKPDNLYKKKKNLPRSPLCLKTTNDKSLKPKTHKPAHRFDPTHYFSSLPINTQKLSNIHHHYQIFINTDRKKERNSAFFLSILSSTISNRLIKEPNGWRGSKGTEDPRGRRWRWGEHARALVVPQKRDFTKFQRYPRRPLR